MSATPIPRTLHMALSGLRDVSVIATPTLRPTPSSDTLFSKEPCQDPGTRSDMNSTVVDKSSMFTTESKASMRMAQTIQELVPNATVRSAHGQMDRKQLERTLVDFMEHRFHVLVCTSIVENGVDLPNVNTIIIDNAHLMGLSQLYQLRGRVGRSEQQGYCTFLIPQKITKEAMEPNLNPPAVHRAGLWFFSGRC